MLNNNFPNKVSIRTERVAKLIQREVAGLLGTDFSEQLNPMVTVTGARVTKDLSIAYLYVSVFGDNANERQATFKHLESLTTKVRTALAARIRHQLRTVPEIRFFLDETQIEASKMENLFDKIRAERSRREPQDDVQLDEGTTE